MRAEIPWVPESIKRRLAKLVPGLFASTARPALFFLVHALQSAHLTRNGWFACPRDLLRRLCSTTPAIDLLRRITLDLQSEGVTLHLAPHRRKEHRCRYVRLDLPPSLEKVSRVLRDGALVEEEELVPIVGARRGQKPPSLRLGTLPAVVAERIRYFAAQPGLGCLFRGGRLGDAFAVAAAMPDTARRRQAITILRHLTYKPRFLPDPARSRRSHRVTDADSLTALPREVRRVLLPTCLGLDLVACHPSILSRMLDAPTALAHFQRCAETGEDPWMSVAAHVVQGSSLTAGEVRGAVKKLVTPLLCGQTDLAFYSRAEALLGRFYGIQAPGERVRSHPVVADLLRAYRVFKAKLVADGHANTCFGVITLDPTRSDREHEARSAIACFVDGIEARFIVAMLRAVETGCRPVADLHDGLLLLFRDLRCTRKVQAQLDAIFGAVKELADQLGVPIRARVDYDPRDEAQRAVVERAICAASDRDDLRDLDTETLTLLRRLLNGQAGLAKQEAWLQSVHGRRSLEEPPVG